MKAMKSFVVEQILLVKNSVNEKLGNNTQLQEKLNGNSSSKRRDHKKNLHTSNANGKSK